MMHGRYCWVYTSFLALFWLLQAARGLTPDPHEVKQHQQQQTSSSTWWETMLHEAMRVYVTTAANALIAPASQVPAMTKEDITGLLLKSEERILAKICSKLQMIDAKIDNLNTKHDNIDSKIKLLTFELEKMEAHLQSIVRFPQPSNMLLLTTILSIMMLLYLLHSHRIVAKMNGQNQSSG